MATAKGDAHSSCRMTKIQWTDRVWNPLRGCSKVSPGCASCYAIRQALRFSRPGAPFHGFVKTDPPNWTGKVAPVPEKLAEPLGWREPAMVFVNSMSDLFHEDVPDEFIAAVFGVMGIASRHTYQVLTKRADRMADVVSAMSWDDCVSALCLWYPDDLFVDFAKPAWPLPNVWLGTSVENQEYADRRIPELLKVPAAVRFLSCEPLLGPIDLPLWRVVSPPHREHWPVEDVRNFWCIAGGESGPHARPCDIAWLRSLRDQCRDAGVPYFLKQVGACCFTRDPARDSRLGVHAPGWNGARDESGMFGLCLHDPKGGDPSEWPADLNVRQFPEPRPCPTT